MRSPAKTWCHVAFYNFQVIPLPLPLVPAETFQKKNTAINYAVNPLKNLKEAWNISKILSKNNYIFSASTSGRFLQRRSIYYKELKVLLELYHTMRTELKLSKTGNRKPLDNLRGITTSGWCIFYRRTVLAWWQAQS